MTEYRRYAQFELYAVVLAALAVGVMFALTRNTLASLAGFSLLALPALRTVFRKGNHPSPLRDERDEAIHRRAMTAGYVAFWVAFVAWGVVVPMAFSQEGSVPLAFVSPAVWVGGWLVICVRSITVLVLDSRGV